MDSFRDSCLSPLQREVLLHFAPRAPDWFLTGGGALAGVHYGHRTTEDLDLFVHAAPGGARTTEDGEIALGAAVTELGAALEPMVRSPDFKRYAVSRGAILDSAPRVARDAVPVGYTAEALEKFRAELVVQLRALAIPPDR